MDAIVKALVGIVVSLVILRMVAELLVGLSDFSDVGCPSRALGAAPVVVRPDASG